MKPKDIVALGVALLILVGSGTVIYSQLAPAGAKTNKAQGEAVEIAPVVAESLDPAALSVFTDSTKTRSFAVPFDLGQGVGNAEPFGR